MDEYQAIAEISRWETAKARRAARKGKLTRLKRQLEGYRAAPLQDLQAHQVSRLKDDLQRERRLYNALQYRCEQLFEEREGTTTEQLSKEIETGEEASDSYAEMVQQAETLRTTLNYYLEAQAIQSEYDTLIEHSDPSLEEFEKDCSCLQKKLATFLQQTASYKESQVLAIRDTFLKCQEDLVRRLNKSRGNRRDKREKASEADTSISDAPRHSRGSKLRLDLPDFTGHPLDWHHFHQLFTSALDRAGDDFSDREKACFLLKAMKSPEAEQIVKSHATSEDGYARALKALVQRFGSAKKVFPHLVHKMTSRETITFSQQGFSRFREKYLLPLQAMKEIKCEDVSQFAASLALENFDSNLRDEWTKFYKTESEVPSLSDLAAFLEPLENNLQSLTLDDKPSSHNSSSRKSTPSASPKNSSSSCALCKENHRLFRCPVFLGYDQARRLRYVKDRRGCTNCLSFNHQTSDCTSTYTCKECNGRHNTLLHRPNASSSTPTTSSSAPNLIAVNQAGPSATLADPKEPPQVSFLHTAMTKATHGDRESIVRVAFDTGASSSLVTETLASRLHLKRHPRRLTITGACGGGVSRHFVELTLTSIHDDSKTITTKFNVVKHLPAAPSPSKIDQVKAEPHLQGLTLADPEFGGQLDVLLGGVDYSHCVVGSLTRGSNSDVAAQPTIFGWTVTGPLDHTPSSSSVFQIQTAEDTLYRDLSFLWELDRTPEFSHLRPEDEEVMQHFMDTHGIDSDGRYIVKLPRISNPPELGCSRNLAMRRYLQNERSLNRKGKSAEFNAALTEYVQLQHAEEVPEEDMTLPHYYLPVHAVFKSSSTTTKVRPVFDASAPTSNGTSLNDTLLQGPNLYPLLSDILLRFRTHNIGFSADISKMFREVKLHSSEKDYHRFLWKNEHGIIKDLRMNRLTFGVRCSPYIATQVLRHLAQSHSESHPEASLAISQSFYVDDFLSGASTVEEAVHIRSQLCSLLSLAGMTLRKWRSSNEEFKSTIPSAIVETENLQISPNDKPIKALGIHWNVNTDNLIVATPDIPQDQPITKRTIASNLGKVFDVLGFYSPVTIVGKTLLRKLWELQIGWDTSPPQVIIESWKQWTSQLNIISSHSIPRRYSSSTNVISQTLHGFADASQEAYGAVVYIQQTYQNGSSSTAIVISKARVLPLKGLSIPRAELTAAYTMAKLLHYCSSILNIKSIIAWSDSSIVLCWLRKAPNSLNAFVANRVQNIHQLIPDAHWRHISSSSNPADMLSRGLPASSLVKSDLWWEGPPWIKQPSNQWPTPQFVIPSNLPEVKSVVLTVPPTANRRLWDEYSSYEHMIRIYARIQRFISNCRLPPDKRCKQSHLQTEECINTKHCIITLAQRESFPEAFKAVQKKVPLPRGHPLRKYHLIIEKNGPLLLTTRVRDYRTARQPRRLIPLSIRSSLTRLLISSLHRRYLHPGTNTLLSIVNETYYIPGLRNYLKGLSRKCPQCQRAYDHGTHQAMGLLPSVRTTPAPPFSSSGVDFAGPFITRRGHTRKPVLVKSYACLFICLATKAIHIELCLNLTTEEFMAALRRFCARRGMPTEIYSDNGTNFVGTRNEFQNIRQMLQSSKQSISHFACNSNIQWKFIPPHSPHMGGLWEAGVKQMKLLMRKLVQPHNLRTDELSSILVEIEAVLNSRPLSPLYSTDPEDVALTPGHFLVGRPLLSPPTANASQAKLSTLRRWQLVQQITQDLWHQWKTHYLRSLQARHKWNGSSHTFKVGDVVFLRDDTFSYRRWPLARISAVYPGADGVVRVVDVMCQGKTLQRSTHHIIPFIDDHSHPSPGPPAVCSGRLSGTEQGELSSP